MRPRVELRIGKLQVIGAELDGERDDAIDVIDVEPMDHAVHDHRVAVFLDQARGLALQIERARRRKKVVDLARRILERKLDVIEPGFLEPGDARFVEADAGRDEIGVVAEPVRLADKDFQIVPLQRLAAGKTALHGADLARFAQHANPVGGRQLVFVACELDRVVAERAVQRTAVGELGEQPERRSDRG